MKFKAVMMTLILVVSLMATGCPKKTTLDKIGGLTIAGVDSYILQLDALKDDGVLSDSKHKELKDQAQAIRVRSVEFRDKIASYAEIKPGDVKAIVTIAGDLIELFDKSLNDEAIVKLPSDTLALKILRGLRIGVNQAKIAVSVLFPDPTPGGVTTASTVKIAPRGIKPSAVVVNLQ
jgi:hypothetical protein